MENVKIEIDEKEKAINKDMEMMQGIDTTNKELEQREEIDIKEEIEIKDEKIESLPDENLRLKEGYCIKDEGAMENNESESEETESDLDEEELESVEEEIEYPYVKAIQQILGIVARPGTFACGGVLENASLDLTVGDLKIKFPLSQKQGEVLKSKATKAPFGCGSKTLKDESVRDAWQVDAKDVILDEEFNTLIKAKVSEIMPILMGESCTDNELVDLELYKLVYYEKDGHFLSHRDTEKAPGMFATLVVQLPAGHYGGALVIRHKGETKVFDFDSVDDRPEIYFFTAFYSDCEHELRKITHGQRLVLIYNLLRKNPIPILDPSNNDLPSIKENFMTTIQNSVEEWQSDSKGPQYLALKLDHLYTDTNTSFKNLKGKDKIRADALCLCNSIEVYLATLIKHEQRCGYNDDPDEYGDKPDLVPESELETECTYILQDWVGVDNKKKPLGKLELHKNEMLLKEEYMFLKFEERSQSEYEYTGNEGCKIDYFYKKKALVFLPKSHEILISCDANLADMIAKCKKLSVSKKDEALFMLKGILLYIEKRHEKAMSQLKIGDKVADILEIMISLDDTAKSLASTFLLTLAKNYEVPDDYFWCPKEKHLVGLPNIKSAITLSNMIKKFGWDFLGNNTVHLLKKCAVSQTVSCAQLVSSLISLEFHEHALCVVEVSAPLIIAKIRYLESDFVAVWIVLLASHDIFSTFFDDFVKKIPKMIDYEMIEVIIKMHKSLKKSILNQNRIKETFQTLLGILQDDGWKGLSMEYVTPLWPVVLFVHKLDCDNSVLHCFVEALIENANSSDFLKESLKLNLVLNEKDNPSVQLMVDKRLRQLQIPYPTFSWAQTDAEVEMSFEYFGGPDLEEVNNFLRSGVKSKSFGGGNVFYNKADALMFGLEYFKNGKYNKKGKYSAKFELRGKDSNVKCKLIKTKNYMDEKVKEYNSLCEEAKVLKKKFGEPKKSITKKKRPHE